MFTVEATLQRRTRRSAENRRGVCSNKYRGNSVNSSRLCIRSISTGTDRGNDPDPRGDSIPTQKKISVVNQVTVLREVTVFVSDRDVLCSLTSIRPREVDCLRCPSSIGYEVGSEDTEVQCIVPFCITLIHRRDL